MTTPGWDPKIVFQAATALSAACFVGVALQRAKVTHLANAVPRMCPSEGRLENETARYIFWSQTPAPSKDFWRILGTSIAMLAAACYVWYIVDLWRFDKLPWNAEDEPTIKTYAVFLVFSVLFPVGTLIGLGFAGFEQIPRFYSDSHGPDKISRQYEALKAAMRGMSMPDVGDDVTNDLPEKLSRELIDRWLLQHSDEQRVEGDAVAALRRAFSSDPSKGAEATRDEVIGLLAPMRDVRYKGQAVYTVNKDGATSNSNVDNFFKVLEAIADEDAFDPRPPIDITSALLFSTAWRVALLTAIMVIYDYYKNN